MSRVRVGQQQQQDGRGHSQQVPGGAAQRAAKHGPLSEEAQLVGNLQEQTGRGQPAQDTRVRSFPFHKSEK